MPDTQNPPVERTGKTELRQVTEAAQELVSELSSTVPQALKLASATVTIAWKLGDLCLKAKDLIPHGGYGTWLQSVGISQPTSSRYVALRSKYPTLNDLESANAQREGYMALLVPNKEHPQLEGDAPLPARNENPIAWVNHFTRWSTKHGETVTHEQIRENARAVFLYMLPAFMDELPSLIQGRKEAA